MGPEHWYPADAYCLPYSQARGEPALAVTAGGEGDATEHLVRGYDGCGGWKEGTHPSGIISLLPLAVWSYLVSVIKVVQNTFEEAEERRVRVSSERGLLVYSL